MRCGLHGHVIAAIGENPRSLSQLGRILAVGGHRAHLFLSHPNVDQIVHLTSPALVIIDAASPAAAWGIFEALRQGDPARPVPAIICSADPSVLRGGLLPGYRCLVQEMPCAPDDLLVAVTGLLPAGQDATVSRPLLDAPPDRR